MKPGDVKEIAERAARAFRPALRATVSLVRAGKRVILAQASGLNGESFNSAEWFQQPGFRSLPKGARQVVIIPINGKSSHAVIVASANGSMYVSDLAEGETAIFNETEGHSIVLRNGKLIEANCDTYRINAAVGVELNTPEVHATGTVVADVDVLAAGKSGAHHLHGGIVRGGASTDQPT